MGTGKLLRVFGDTFMGDKRAHIVSVLTALVLLSSAAFGAGVPAGWASHDSGISTFTNVSGGAAVADVTWHVYSDYGVGSGMEGNCVYAYRISNTSGAGLSFFSVEIPVSAVIATADHDGSVGDVPPDLWGAVGSGPQSVEAMFSQTIGAGESSCLLWFVCDQEAGWAEGALVGMSAGYVFAKGNIMAPVPEPATIAMLGVGGILLLLRRRK
jgi:hypothetical protein